MVLWTLFIISPWNGPPVSMVMVLGGASVWLFIGYSLYIIVGVVAMAVTAVFYHYIEDTLGRGYSGALKYLAWGHFVLMNVGVAGAAWLLMYAGYVAGVASLPVSVGGLGLDQGQVIERILQYYPVPVHIFVLTAVIGVLLGGLGYLINIRSKD